MRGKSHCKKNNKCVEHVFHLLLTHLEKDHSEIRFSAFQIASELFSRSHLFRTMLLDSFQTFMDLTVETDFDNPLPPPKITADKLKLEALTTIRGWNDKYGIAYRKLKRGFDYLKHVKKINFDQLQNINQTYAQQFRLNQQQIVNATKLDKVVKEIDSNLWEVEACVAEINNGLKLIVPTFLEEDIPSVENSAASNSPQSSGKSGNNTQDRQAYGLPDRGYTLQLNLAEISTINVTQTSDNKAVFARIKDCIKSANRIHLPRLREWLTTGGKCGAPPETMRKLVDVKDTMQKCLDKYNELNGDCESDEEDFDDFIEVPEASSTKRFKSKVSLKAAKKEKLKRSSDTNIWKPLRSDNSMNDPTSYQYALAKQAESRKRAKKEDNFSSQLPRKKEFPAKKSTSHNGTPKKDPLKEKAPVVPFGHDLLTWDKERFKELRQNLKLGATKELDIGHRFWSGHSASEGDSGVSDAALNSLTSRTIEFTGTFEAVIKSCRAPLPNGKLCPRKDRHKCPFHGKIIDRDVLGNPVSSDQPSTSSFMDRPASSDWQDPSFLRDVHAGLGGKIDLSLKRKKGKKKSENGLTNLKTVKNTSRGRLQKKVLQPSSLKRVNETLNQLDMKRNFDKFGNNFNYALH
ncbi:unnamed protein product [Clavelina lepadiformis]|uniref:UV-stimulated scaffold protein A n=1 Tax=Clavelina lepadiformis TaxID=159417 RepID=A0ABP0GLF8_CLALP